MCDIGVYDHIGKVDEEREIFWSDLIGFCLGNGYRLCVIGGLNG